jgi:DNA-binding transcriptional ArsR family regulator
MQMSDTMVARVVERFAALADPVRVRILLRLKEGEADVSSLVAVAGVGQASVSKHLSVLRSAGWVESRRVGTRVVCRVADKALFELCRLVCDGVIRQSQAQHEALLGSQTRA